MAVAFAGCRSVDSEGMFSSVLGDLENSKQTPRQRNGVSQRISGDGATFGGVVDPGSGQFVSRRPPAVSVENGSDGVPQFRVNLVDAPIAAAAKNILGDILELTYTVDPRVQGAITLQTSAPVSRDTLVDIFETTLAANGFTIVRNSGTYQIVPLSEALANTPSVSVPSVAPRGPGIKVLVVELQHIAAEEMRNILSPISREGSILRVDNDRNYIMLAGTNADLAAMRDAIGVFDVDWMQGMSVALHPLKTSRPVEVANELETIFRTTDGPGQNVIRFVPNERLNSVLVISSRPQYLRRAEGWIRQLDRIASTNEEQLFVYHIQNRTAEELAGVLQSVLSGQGSGPGGAGSPVSPDLEEVELASADAPGQASGGAVAPKVVADTENNALLISTTARDYERIERILEQLDVLPTQVMLEAVIAEVTLNDELKFGVRWFFESGNFSVGLSDLASGLVAPAFPGLSWSFASSDLEVTINALSSVTDVNVISSPTLMALNNQEATLQIGDQVPIVTRTATGVEDPNAPIVNTVTLKDTGIILNITPRVNSAGRVLLDIEQEASSVVRTTSSGIDSPTIQQRKISTRVVVNDGEALTLGGLIQERKTNTRGQVPILGEIPVVGNAFKNKTDKLERTELLILIRPRVLRNFQDARAVNEEFRDRLDFGRSETPENRIRRDLRRLQ
uniref:type II secretion system secretin GspD n=1 Tax=Aquibium sp. A9E412 TaxID=2976767 RepID=UPI0025B0C06C|nr:type II secretion system secretin GspD [Aquibium sp. A9E412]